MSVCWLPLHCHVCLLIATTLSCLSVYACDTATGHGAEGSAKINNHHDLFKRGHIWWFWKTTRNGKNAETLQGQTWNCFTCFTPEDEGETHTHMHTHTCTHTHTHCSLDNWMKELPQAKFWSLDTLNAMKSCSLGMNKKDAMFQLTNQKKNKKVLFAGQIECHDYFQLKPYCWKETEKDHNVTIIIFFKWQVFCCVIMLSSGDTDKHTDPCGQECLAHCAIQMPISTAVVIYIQPVSTLRYQLSPAFRLISC